MQSKNTSTICKWAPKKYIIVGFRYYYAKFMRTQSLNENVSAMSIFNVCLQLLITVYLVCTNIELYNFLGEVSLVCLQHWRWVILFVREIRLCKTREWQTSCLWWHSMHCLFIIFLIYKKFKPFFNPPQIMTILLLVSGVQSIMTKQVVNQWIQCFKIVILFKQNLNIRSWSIDKWDQT